MRCGSICWISITPGGTEKIKHREVESTVIENTKTEEEKAMTKTMKIEGMMCPHCEATVKKASSKP